MFIKISSNSLYIINKFFLKTNKYIFNKVNFTKIIIIKIILIYKFKINKQINKRLRIKINNKFQNTRILI